MYRREVYITDEDLSKLEATASGRPCSVTLIHDPAPVDRAKLRRLVEWSVFDQVEWREHEIQRDMLSDVVDYSRLD